MLPGGVRAVMEGLHQSGVAGGAGEAGERLVGVPLWLDRSGNHAWVEVWDGSRWRYTGAAEPTEDRLDEAWETRLGLFSRTRNRAHVRTFA